MTFVNDALLVTPEPPQLEYHGSLSVPTTATPGSAAMGCYTAADEPDSASSCVRFRRIYNSTARVRPKKTVPPVVRNPPSMRPSTTCSVSRCRMTMYSPFLKTANGSSSIHSWRLVLVEPVAYLTIELPAPVLRHIRNFSARTPTWGSPNRLS